MIRLYKILLITTILIFSQNLWAQKTWVGGTDNLWSTGTNWNPVGAPTAIDAVIIPDAVTTNVDALFGGSIASLTLGAGVSGSVTLQRSLTVSGNVNITGGATFNAGSYNFILGGNLTVGDATFGAANFNSQTSTVFFINGVGATQTLQSFTTPLTLNNVTVQQGILNAGAGVIFDNGTGSAMQINMNGTLTVSFPDQVGVTLSQTGGGGNPTIFYGGSSTLVYNSVNPLSQSSQLTGGEFASTINNLTVSVAGTFANGLDITTVGTGNVDLNLNISSGKITHTGQQLNVGGNVTTGTLTSNGSYDGGTIVMTGNQSQFISAGSGSITNLTINKSNTTDVVTVNSGILNVTDKLTVQNGILSLGSGSTGLNISGGGSPELEIQSGGTFQTGGKTITNSGIFDLQSGSDWQFTSAGATPESTPTGITFADVTLNQSNNAGVNISGSITVDGTIEFQNNGTINVSGSNTLTLGASAGAIPTANANRYINGPVTKASLSGSYDFPVGDVAAYRPVTVNVTSGSDDVAVQYATTNPNVGNTPTGIKSISNNRKWTITPGASVADFDVTLEYTDPGFTIGNENNMRILRGTSSSSDWVDADTSPTIDTGNNLVTASGLTTTTPVNFTVAEALGSYTWDGGGGDNFVTNADNWSDNVLPGSGDDATIDGSFTPVINSAITWGSLTISGGAVVTISDNSTPALTLDGGSDVVLSITGTGSALNATANPASAGEVIRLTGTGEISVASGGSITYSGSNNNGIENGSGTPLATSRQSYESGTTFVWNANGSAFQAQSYGNLSLDPTSAISKAGFTVNNDMQINGQTITFTSALTIAGDLAINAGTFSPSANVNLSGNLLVDGTLAASSGSFLFEGTGSQQGISGSGTATFYNFTMNNTNGIGLSRDITISNILNFSADGLILTGSNVLTMGTGGSVSGASSSRYISGRVAKIYPVSGSAQSFVFRTGKGGEYLPLTMRFGTVSGGTITVTVEQQNSDPHAIDGTLSGLNKISTVRYWDLTRSGSGTGTGHQVTLNYNENDGVDVNRLSLRVAQYDGTDWANIGGQGSGVPTGTISSSAMTGFGGGYVTFGDAVGDNSLPISLSSFQAKLLEKGGILLKWITESELQNDGFNLYRKNKKLDSNWQLLNSSLIPGQGNTAEKSEYEYRDHSVQAGITYEYMLESVSYAGVRVQEKVIEVLVPMPTEYATLGNYPNPFNPATQIGFRLPETSEVSILIYGIRGNLVRELALNQSFEAGDHFMAWDATDNNGQPVASGMYVYLFKSGTYHKTEKMLLLK